MFFRLVFLYMTFVYRKFECQGYTDFDSEHLVKVAGKKITIAVKYKLP